MKPISKPMKTNLPKLYSWITGAFILVMVTACGSSHPAAPKIAESEQAIRQAEQGKAQDYAPLELRNAKEKLNEAKKLAEDKKQDAATDKAEEALVDAQLAGIKTQSSMATAALDEIQASIKALREEIKKNQQ